MKNIFNIFQTLCIFVCSLILAACGGGGGSSGTSPTSPPVTVVTGTPSVVVSVLNAAGTKVTSIDLAGAFTAQAKVSDATSTPVPNRLVTFSLPDSTIASLGSTTTALTNSAGLATISIAPSSVSARGAVTLTASAIASTTGTAVVTGSIDLAVAAANVTLSPIQAGATSLPSGGNTSLSVTASVGGVPASSVAVNVNYVVSCGRINGSGTNISVTTNGSGIAAVDYSSTALDGSLCSGAVTITASTPGASASVISLNIAVPSANAVTFVSATPAQVFVAGSGAVEQSQVKFKVLSSAGTALAGVPVTFSLQINPGGVGLNASGSIANATGTTDSTGFVSVAIFSGTIPGPVKVRAALTANPAVFSESQNLTVSSGPPSQRFMSLSVQTFNIEGAAIDGTSTNLTVRLADRQGNPVDDGTVVNFTAEGGQVASSCATLKAAGISACSVSFISQNPRTAGGRVSVLAYTNGTKDYVDVNGNNRYDAGVDTLLQMGDAFRDDNENGVFDIGEFVVPRSGTSVCVGAGEPFPSRTDTCDTLLATTVRQQIVINFASTDATVTPVGDVTTSKATFLIGSADYPLLPMPAGSKIATTIILGSTTSTCAVANSTGSPTVDSVPTANPLRDLRTTYALNFLNCGVTDSLIVAVTAPSGKVTSVPFNFKAAGGG